MPCTIVTMTKLLRQATTYTTHPIMIIIPTIVINPTIIINSIITKSTTEYSTTEYPTTEYPTIRTTAIIVIKT